MRFVCVIQYYFIQPREENGTRMTKGERESGSGPTRAWLDSGIWCTKWTSQPSKRTVGCVYCSFRYYWCLELPWNEEIYDPDAFWKWANELGKIYGHPRRNTETKATQSPTSWLDSLDGWTSQQLGGNECKKTLFPRGIIIFRLIQPKQWEPSERVCHCQTTLLHTYVRMCVHLESCCLSSFSGFCVPSVSRRESPFFHSLWLVPC